MIAYKLFRVRRDGSIGSLFINRRARLPLLKWMEANGIPTKGFAYRPGWHALCKPEAPHLSERGRRWYTVEVKHFKRFVRPVSQGGKWVLAQKMRILTTPVSLPDRVVKVWPKRNGNQSATQPRPLLP